MKKRKMILSVMLLLSITTGCAAGEAKALSDSKGRMSLSQQIAKCNSKESAISIAERIYKEGDAAVKDYFKFLSSGGSDSPVELLKLAGVDLTEKDAYKAAMKSFENALTEFESL